jgi:hypothetical protein
MICPHCVLAAYACLETVAASVPAYKGLVYCWKTRKEEPAPSECECDCHGEEKK